MAGIVKATLNESALTSMSKRLKIRVPSFEEKINDDSSGTPYTAYLVHVSDVLHGTEWILTKRYSDFSKIFSQMNQLHPQVLANYKFPNKSMFNTFSTFTKIRRREGFDELMQVLMKISPMPEEVSYFLELQENIISKTVEGI